MVPHPAAEPAADVPGTDQLPLLLLMRHAKAGPAGGPDHARQLAARGRRDAPLVGRWLADNGLLPDLVVCSDAVRTRETSELVVSGTATDIEVRATGDLYGASVEAVLEVVAGTADDVHRLLVVGHEPTSSETLAVLTGSSPMFPTSAVAVVRLAGRWGEVGQATGTLVGFRTPKG